MLGSRAFLTQRVSSVSLKNNETSDPCDWLARHIVTDSNSEAETESVTFEVLSAFWLLAGAKTFTSTSRH